LKRPYLQIVSGVVSVEYNLFKSYKVRK